MVFKIFFKVSHVFYKKYLNRYKNSQVIAQFLCDLFVSVIENCLQFLHRTDESFEVWPESIHSLVYISSQILCKY